MSDAGLWQFRSTQIGNLVEDQRDDTATLIR